MDIAIVILKALGISFGACIATLFLAVVGTMIWVKRAIKGKTYCLILDPNRQMHGKLCKQNPNGTVTLKVGRGKQSEEMNYLTPQEKQFYTMWPPGFPEFVQEPVSTLLYTANCADAIDPFNPTTSITPAVLRRISDDSVIKHAFREARDHLTGKTTKLNSTYIILGAAVVIIVLLIIGFMVFQLRADMGDVKDTLQQVLERTDFVK